MLSKFEIDAKGFAELQAGREPWTLAREPVANSFDEKSVTTVNVTLSKNGHRPAVLVVEDDGEGFANIKDTYTLYADTLKRREPEARGRFNRGEKELLSIAICGSVRTTTGTIRFDKDTRYTGRGRTERGTIIEVELPWTKAEVDEVVRRLRSFIPPEDKTYTVNGLIVSQRLPSYRVTATLETVRKAPDGALRCTSRKTKIYVHRPQEGEEASLMEMGIPVMSLTELAVPFIIDVQQKIPMAPERDSVRQAYLRDVLAEVLNVVNSDLTDVEVNAKWVNLAIPDKRVEPGTVKTVKEKRYGKNVLIMNPFNRTANERASDAGYNIISAQGMDPEVRERMYEDASLGTTTEVFPDPVPGVGSPVSTPGVERTRRFIEALADALEMRRPSIAFVNLPGAWANADCSGPGITFYVNRTGKAIFDEPSEELLALIAHELAHIGPMGKSPYVVHDEEWGRRGLKILAFLSLNTKLLALLDE